MVEMKSSNYIKNAFSFSHHRDIGFLFFNTIRGMKLVSPDLHSCPEFNFVHSENQNFIFLKAIDTQELLSSHKKDNNLGCSIYLQ